jgi:tetratricopeptide (TPR) repeat protein
MATWSTFDEEAFPMKTPPNESGRDLAGPPREAPAQDHVDPVQRLRRLSAHEPNEPSHLAQLADLYEERGLLNMAIACAQQAVARDPEDPRLLRLLGRALEAGGKPDLAQNAYLAAVAVGANPRHPDPWLGLARLERARGRPAMAEQYARRALDVAPYSAEVYAELARILLHDARAGSAFAVLARGLQCAPGNPELIRMRDSALPVDSAGIEAHVDQDGPPR